jgi:hypothetical protein
MLNLNLALLKAGVLCGTEKFEELILRKYKEQYDGIPVDKFLCNPSKAIFFSVGICRELNRTAEQLPAPVILETLLNLRKRGEIRAIRR